MRSVPRALAVASCLLLGATAASSAFAQADVDRATARKLGEAGQQALAAQDYKTAEDDFRRADSLVHAPTLMLGLARALAGEGKLVEAQETYKRIVREGVAPGSPAVFQRAVDEATKEVETLAPRIGAVTISVKMAGGEPAPAALQVTWDGSPVNSATLGIKRPANPGPHVVHAAADGYRAVDLKVEVPAGGAVDAPLSLAKDPNAPPVTAPPVPGPQGATPSAPPPDQAPAARSGFGVWPWVAIGVGGAGLAVGAITGAMAIGKHSDLASKCGSGPCPADQQSNVDSYNTLGMVSTVGFIVGGVGAAAGVTLLLLQPKAEAIPPAAGLHVVPVLGLGSVGAVGTF
jgi:hypothetical protein